MEQLKITNVDIWVKLRFQVSFMRGGCVEKEGKDKGGWRRKGERSGQIETKNAVRSSFHEIYRSSPVN